MNDLALFVDGAYVPKYLGAIGAGWVIVAPTGVIASGRTDLTAEEMCGLIGVQYPLRSKLDSDLEHYSHVCKKLRPVANATFAEWFALLHGIRTFRQKIYDSGVFGTVTIYSDAQSVISALTGNGRMPVRGGFRKIAFAVKDQLKYIPHARLAWVPRSARAIRMADNLATPMSPLIQRPAKAPSPESSKPKEKKGIASAPPHRPFDDIFKEWTEIMP